MGASASDAKARRKLEQNLSERVIVALQFCLKIGYISIVGEILYLKGNSTKLDYLEASKSLFKNGLTKKRTAAII